MSELSDYQLGHDIMAQKELLLRSYETNDEDAIEDRYGSAYEKERHS